MPATKTSPPGSAATAAMRSSVPPGPSIWRSHTGAPDAASTLTMKASQSRPFQALPARTRCPRPRARARACSAPRPASPCSRGSSRCRSRRRRHRRDGRADLPHGAPVAPDSLMTGRRGCRSSRIDLDIGHQDRIAERGAQDRNRTIPRANWSPWLDVRPGAIAGRRRILRRGDADVVPVERDQHVVGGIEREGPKAVADDGGRRLLQHFPHHAAVGAGKALRARTHGWPQRALASDHRVPVGRDRDRRCGVVAARLGLRHDVRPQQVPVAAGELERGEAGAVDFRGAGDDHVARGVHRDGLRRIVPVRGAVVAVTPQQCPAGAGIFQHLDVGARRRSRHVADDDRVAAGVDAQRRSLRRSTTVRRRFVSRSAAR